MAPIQVVVTAQEDNQPTSTDQIQPEPVGEVAVEDQGREEDAST